VERKKKRREGEGGEGEGIDRNEPMQEQIEMIMQHRLLLK